MIYDVSEKKSTQFTLDKEWMDDNNVAEEDLEEVLAKLKAKDGYIIYEKEFNSQSNSGYGFVVHPQKIWLEQGYQENCSEK